jgi:serine/threonine protein kinase
MTRYDEIRFPKSIKIKDNKLKIPLGDFYKNVVTINGVDYIPYYLNNEKPGNKGGNGYVLKLVEAQNFDDEEGYPEEPDKVIKICKSWINKFGSDNFKSSQFKTETDILLKCQDLPNIISLFDHGKSWIKVEDQNNNNKPFYFYTMEYATDDLPSFLEKHELYLSDRIELSIEVCESLRQIYSLDYYHRDIKPDNILFIEEDWKISDLGLAKHRDDNLEHEIKGGWVGPRGWMSPESMNKFLAENRPWEKFHDCKIDHKSDLYQIGKVIWYILHGSSPEGCIKRKDYQWKGDIVYQILKTLLNHDKERRYNHISEVLRLLRIFWRKNYNALS